VLKLKDACFFLACYVGLNFAWASTPLDVFSLVDQREAALLEASVGNLDFQNGFSGLSADISLKPNLSYSDIRQDGRTPEDPSFKFDYELGIGLSYIYDEVELIDKQISLLEAENKFRSQRRKSLERALLNHADWLRLQLASEKATIELRTKQEDLEEINLDENATPAQIQSAELSVQRAETSLGLAQRRLLNAEAVFEPLGLNGPASFEPILFVLPNGVITETFSFQKLNLILEKRLAEERQLKLIRRAWLIRWAS